MIIFGRECYLKYNILVQLIVKKDVRKVEGSCCISEVCFSRSCQTIIPSIPETISQLVKLCQTLRWSSLLPFPRFCSEQLSYLRSVFFSLSDNYSRDNFPTGQTLLCRWFLPGFPGFVGSSEPVAAVGGSRVFVSPLPAHFSSTQISCFFLKSLFLSEKISNKK